MGDGSTKPSLLVTVGSTLFPKLTDAVLSAPILELLADRISTLRVQLGRAEFPTGLNELLTSFPLGQREGHGSLSGKYKGMEVDVFRYTSDFEELVNSSGLVVSHAGPSVYSAGKEKELIGRVRVYLDDIKSWETTVGST
jgi:beta-1,4-N-acetylglucosaminyltransferase